MPVTPRGGSYEASITRKGRRWRYAFATEAEARGWEADALAALANGRPVPEPSAAKHGAKPGVLTLQAATDKFWNHAYVGSQSDWPKTVALYFKALNKMFPGYTFAEFATQDKTDEYVKSLYDRGQAQSTVNSKVSTIGMLFKWGVENRFIESAPKMKIRKCNNQRMGYMSVDDEASVLRIMRQHENFEAADAVVVLVDTGLRPSELFRLIGRDYNPNDGKITVQKAKNGEGRAVPCTTRVREVFMRRRQAAALGQKMFGTLTKERLRAAWDRVREAMQRTDDPEFIPYILRHTCASRLVQRGVALGVVMRWMGHKSMQMTMRYAKHAPGDFDAAAAALEGAAPRPFQVIQGGS
ncbi:XerC Integrase [uncultured Caudovirales phage]|uniref:Integrase n=1 Tax=uncultured Caudovirales phage TaxID=2100421 RepID=A0A6J5P1R9_9CAUD|nr:XerC Integrase [uncultured Caudovirales phage]